jgi:hypothetical protein
VRPVSRSDGNDSGVTTTWVGFRSHYVQEMKGQPGTWSISTGEGVSLDSEELVELLAAHHRRLIDTWQGFSPAQWDHQSRNTEWTVHRTVRHVADAMGRVAAAMNGEPLKDENAFDPRSTPEVWLAASEGEPPMATINRFAASSTHFRSAVRDRRASGDESHERTVYGTAHWTVNVAHVLWDSWLHERDVLLPLGQPAPSSEEEERLVGLYGLLMALVPSMMREQSISSTVQLRGIGVRTIEVGCEAGSIATAEVPEGKTSIVGATPAAIDALAGRGDSVADALPGAPEELGFLAAHFTS